MTKSLNDLCAEDPEENYQRYLSLIGVCESEMPEIQKNEQRRAFMAGNVAALLSIQALSYQMKDNLEWASAIEQLMFKLNEFFEAEVQKQMQGSK